MTNYRYTGQELDPESGLYYYKSRYYEPMIGRFISADPALNLYIPKARSQRQLPNGGVFNPITLNLYAYANNNPIKYVDPNGLWTKEVHYGYTRLWVERTLGKERAERIAYHDNDVDSFSPFKGKGSLPIIGDQSFHFNTNPGGQDT